MKFELPKLNYEYGALEPFLSARLMELHHSKHHQIYIDKLNTVISETPEAQNRTIEDLLSNLETLPESKRTAIKNFGGGHYNHSLFWECMSPNNNKEIDVEIIKAIENKYESFDNFVSIFSDTATKLFGSGWVWLNPDLSITTSANQDNPLNDKMPAPILCLDIWEHAYYVDYTYDRAGYVKNWFNVIDWERVSKRYLDYNNL